MNGIANEGQVPDSCVRLSGACPFFYSVLNENKNLISTENQVCKLGVWRKAFDGVADYLSKTVTEESQIEAAIAGVEPLLKAFQGDVDKVRTEKSELQKQYDELKAKQEKGGEPGKKNAIN